MIHCAQGKDRSVAVLLAALVVFWQTDDNEGKGFVLRESYAKLRHERRRGIVFEWLGAFADAERNDDDVVLSYDSDARSTDNSDMDRRLAE